MPFSLFGGGSPNYFDFTAPPAAPAAPGGFGLPDLYQPTPPVEYPAPPPPISSVRDLSEDDRRELKRRAWLLAAQAFGGPPGQMGSSLAAAGAASQDGREQAIRAARARQKEDYQIKRQGAEEESQQRRQKVEETAKERQARAVMSAYNSIVDKDPSLAPEAEAAARAGSLAGLRQLTASIPVRNAMRARGVDPDDPSAVANYEREEKIKDELDKQSKLNRQKLDDLPEELGIRDDSEDRQMEKRLGLEHHFRELEARQRATKDGSSKPMVREGSDGFLYVYHPETGRWVKNKDVPGGFKPELRLIGGVVHRVDPATGIAHQVKTEAQVKQEQADAEEKKRRQEEERKDEERRKAQDVRVDAGKASYMEKVGTRIRRSLQFPAKAPADVGKKAVVSTPTVKNPSQKPPAPHVLQEPETVPGAGKITTEPRKTSPLRGKAAAPPPRRADMAARLESAARDKSFDLAGARRAGWSDDEIAAALGVK